MKLASWLDFFRRHAEKKIFTFADLAQMTGAPRGTLRVELSRLAARGVLPRLARELYANPFSPPSVEEVAMALRWPSCISLEYALSAQGVLSQTAFTVTCVTTRLPRSFLAGGTAYEYHRIARRLFWGWREDPGTGVRVALPEKALLDLVYIRVLRTRELDPEGLASLLDDMYPDELDPGLLRSFLDRFGPPHAERMAAALAAAGLRV
ncbi:MAG: hypothetical protein H5T97_02825 [Firmicutes bacterium]|nr:hypothetical protein [Bacillota bacterium]